MESERGSLWKKWDLHVHTPDSIIQNYTNNSNDVWGKYISDLESLPEEIKVLGINDYIFIDGYERLLEEKALGRLKNIERLFPVIELRINKFGGTESELSRVNFHVIFSDEVKPDTIKSQFISALTQKYEINPKYKNDKTKKWSASPTRESIEELGRMIIDSVPEKEKGKYSTPLKEGFNNLNFDLDKINELLNKHYFVGQYITGVGKTEWWNIKWNDNSIADKKDTINKVDIVFTAAESPNGYKKSIEALRDGKVNFHLLDCSDAHNFSNTNDKDRLGNCFTWIKGDTSFLGLRFALKEFENRVFIGDIPDILRRVKSSGSKFIDKLTIKKIPETKMEEEWFDCCVEFNSGLVAIIGNKGSGKSALAEIIGLVCNTKHYKEFSFLNKEKFLKKPDVKAKYFEAQLAWSNGNESSRLLSDNVATSEQEYAQCIPQKFLERICNDVDNDNFNQELQRVIFSHISNPDRLGQSNLDELIDYVTNSIEETLIEIRNELNEINEKIIEMEELSKEPYKSLLKSQYKSKLQQLKDLRKNRPKVIVPAENDAKTQQISKLIDTYNIVIKETENEITKKEERSSKIKIWHTDLANFEMRITNIERDVESLYSDYGESFEEMGLKIKKIVKLTSNHTNINKKRIELDKEITQLDKELNKNTTESLLGVICQLREEIGKLSAELTEPGRIIEESKQALEDWKSQRRVVIGTENITDTALYFRDRIRSLKEIPQNIIKAKEERTKKCRNIHNYIKKLGNEYSNMYKGVEDFIVTKKPAREMEINFSVVLAQKEFKEILLDSINKTFSSSFTHSNDGEKLVIDKIENCDFNDEDKVIEFVEYVDDIIHFNIFDSREAVDVQFLMRKGKSVLDLYNFLFGISYLRPMYMLKFGNKTLDELSPGEKGMVLLIFYLLVDKNEMPLIIDQPEDNLDNQTIVKVLVNCVKDSRKRRQIFMVTHNPNLAVVCDADQIITSSIDKQKGNKVTYCCGALENPLINPNVVNILEGTKVAFDIRGNSYFEVE